MFLIVLLLGTFIGSFLNVCIYRIPREESIVFPGSHCPECQTALKFYELVPIISWLALRGKCRTCNNSISIRYPAVELLTGLLLGLVYWVHGLSLSFLFMSFLAILLIIMTFIDYDHQIIPDGLVLWVAGGALAQLTVGLMRGEGINLIQATVGFLIGGGFFLVIAVVSNGGMGGGDIKLMAALGIWFGWRGILLVMFLAFIIGGVVSVGLLISERKGRKSMVPFGPFIAVGALITGLYGNELIQWYFSQFL